MTKKSNKNNTKEKTQSRFFLNFNCYPFCMRNVRVEGFTNYLKDKEQLSSMHKIIFEKITEEIYNKTFNELISNKNYHFHSIKKNRNIELIKKILMELYKQFRPNQPNEFYTQAVTQILETEQLYQFGIGGLRIVGILDKIDDNCFLNVLFIDYNHLLNPNPKYNSDDYSRYRFGLFE